MADESHEILKKYVSDMVGVVRHVHEAIQRQLQDDAVDNFPDSKYLLGEINQELNTQRNHLDGLANNLEASGLAGSKNAFTAATGFLAGIYDRLRSIPVSKDLRDDYVALTMCCAAYEMLHTTGLALGHAATAEVALRHLQQLAPFVPRIGQLIPHVVARELAKNGLNVDTTAAETAARNNREAWSGMSNPTV